MSAMDNHYNRISGKGTKRKIGLILILAALLPAIFYTAYELSSLSSTEELLQSIYSKQLDVILFSINQYSLDATQSWSSEINTLILSESPGQLDSATRLFLKKTPSVRGVLFSDSSGRSMNYIERLEKKIDGGGLERLSFNLEKDSAVIGKLLRYASAGYRKIEPIVIGDSSTGRSLMLAFVTLSRQQTRRIAGFVLDAKAFVTGVLESKLIQAAGDEFQLAVIDRRNRQIVVATSPLEISELKQEKELWLFPDYRIGIRLKGTSIEDIVQARSKRNLIFITLLDILLLSAVWLVYRTLKKEMELVRLKGDFISNVSHELRTPLSLIRMFTETLSMKRVTSEMKKQEYYSTILQETERLTRLINNILNFSRMEAGKKQYHFASIDLNDVVENVMKTFQIHLQHEGFKTITRLMNMIPPVHADSEAVAEAMINIIDNAIKYSENEKYIRTSTGVSGKMIYVEIEDHGIGIEAQHHAKIFETFYRVTTGLTNNIKGSGLGLSLVKHIMDAHDGTIEVVSTPGKGSTFRLLFPPSTQQNDQNRGS
jgi:two-component system, OmpR family, phosphate regulon sensor histidine kinase PhoR